MRFCNCGKLLGSWLRERGLSIILVSLAWPDHARLNSRSKIYDCMQAVPFNAHQKLHVEQGRLWRVYESVNSICFAALAGKGVARAGRPGNPPSVPTLHFASSKLVFVVCVLHLPAMSSRGEELGITPCLST